MVTPLLQLQQQVHTMEQRCVLHEQLFAQLQANIQANHQSLDARLDKIETDLSLVTFPVKLIKIALKAFFKIEI